MGYNNSVYKKIYDEYSQKYLIARQRATEKERELHRLFPEVASIDIELSKTGLEIFSASLSGENYKEKLSLVRAKNEALQVRRAEILIANGYPADYSNIKYECVKCSDTGFVDNVMCSCMKEALTLAGIENSGFASLVKDQRFDNFSLDYYANNAKCYEKMKENVEFLKKYIEEFSLTSPISILMMGGTGLGKTHLSSAIAGEIIKKGYDVFYTGAVDLFSTFETERFKRYSIEPNELIERYFECDLLIIDDLGTETITPFSVSTLFNLINDRLGRKKPTIVNTNLTREEIKNKYNDRITSRLGGEYKVLPFFGSDVRVQKLRK